ncbi:hypothetical protein Dda_3631 [Drechslerella dactyloides]|uniref:H-type lectin domain-containing protein n=1 Tax=Drechslerella dactyloides TaxID=74499 RepID=A0AAD6IYB6_DREDA|nr:hypothetical protein Dda_3631 [Drechslerella dactyloides]
MKFSTTTPQQSQKKTELDEAKSCNSWYIATAEDTPATIEKKFDLLESVLFDMNPALRAKPVVKAGWGYCVGIPPTRAFTAEELPPKEKEPFRVTVPACQYVRPNPRGLPPGYLIALEQRLADTEAALRLSVKIILELTLADAQPSPTSQECLDEDYSTLRAQNAVKHLASEPSLREMALEKICGRHSSPDTYPEKRERQGEWERWPLRSMTDVLSWWSCVDRAAAEDGKEGAAVVENSEAEDPYELPPAHFEDLELEDTPSQIIPDLNLQSLDKCRRQIDGRQGFNSFTQQICFDDAVIIDAGKVGDVLKKGGLTMQDITAAMRPPDTGRAGATANESIAMLRQRSWRPRHGSASSLSSSPLLGSHCRSRSNTSRYSPTSERSPSSVESARRGRKNKATESSPSSSVASTSPGRSSGRESADVVAPLASVRIRHGEPVSKGDWGSISDGFVPGQDVRFVARFVNNLSDITEDMNIASAGAIKKGRINNFGDNFIDVEKFKQADLNFYMRVRVINQKVDLKEGMQFNPEWVVVEDEFTNCFGDTFISGFVEGGELNALLSIKVLNKAKLQDVETGVKAAFGKSLFTLDTEGKTEWEKRDIDDHVEIAVSAIWSGGGRIKSSEKQIPIHSLMDTAANFPDLIASEPHRTHCILTPYSYLRSFYKDGELQIPLAPYIHASRWAKELLDAYMDYRGVRRRLEEDILDIQTGDKEFQSKEYARRTNVATKRQLSSVDDDSKFKPTIDELEQAIKAATCQMQHIVTEVEHLSLNPEDATRTRYSATFQDPDVFRSRLPKLLPKGVKQVVARSAVVIQSDESDLYLVSSGGHKANMSRGKPILRVSKATHYNFAGSVSLGDGNQDCGHSARRIRTDTPDGLQPRVFTGIRQLSAISEAFTDPSLRFRMYSTNETASGFDCCFHDWSSRRIMSGTFDVLAVSRTDTNFLTGTVEGRGVREWAIKFSRTFRRAPEIVIWLTGVDVNRTQNPIVDLEVRAVTTTGFRFIPKISDPNTWVSFSWLAYSPEAGGIVSGFLEFGGGPGRDSGKVAFPPGVFQKRPKVLAALHGFTLFPAERTEGEQRQEKQVPQHVGNAGAGEVRVETKAGVEMDVWKTTRDGFSWTYRSTVLTECKIVMQWIAVA